MKKSLLLIVLLTMSTYLSPLPSPSQLWSSINQKHVECGVGIIISLALLKNHSSRLSSVLGTLMLLTSIGLYASPHANLQTACNKLYKQLIARA